jgi:NadR type nicotinamide-nucleotide adenylyltransferase
MDNHQPKKLIKIVAVGPESTGKSTLCAQLAAHFSTVWCQEYAREYLLQHGTDYSLDDLLTIAEGQLILEDDSASAAINQFNQHDSPGLPVLFIDTDMYVMKVWCEFVFGRCHQRILDEIVSRKYDGYLLCKPDIPWTKDELREYPELNTREQLYCTYKDLLINQHEPWTEVSGNDPDRTENAIRWVEQLIQSLNKKF